MANYITAVHNDGLVNSDGTVFVNIDPIYLSTSAFLNKTNAFFVDSRRCLVVIFLDIFLHCEYFVAE